MREYKTLKCIKDKSDVNGNKIFTAGNTYKAMRRHFGFVGEDRYVPVLRVKTDQGYNFIIEDKTSENISIIKNYKEYFEEVV